MFVSIDKVRSHLNLDDYTEDDEYIIHLINAAEDATAKRLNVKSLSYIVDENTGYLPESVTHQILLLVGSWYAARETFSYQSVSQLPHSFDFLADLNKNYKAPF